MAERGLKVVSWNTQARLTRLKRRGRSPEQILEHIESLDADVVYLAEASDGDKVEPATLKKINQLGYQIKFVPYEGGVKHEYYWVKNPTMALLYRPDKVNLLDYRIIRPGDARNMLAFKVSCFGQTVQFLGIHIDDLDEEVRQNQVADLTKIINSSQFPVVMMGDYNAMYYHDKTARYFRSRLFKILVRLIVFNKLRTSLGRVMSMAEGATMANFSANTDLVDADTKMQPTILTTSLGGLPLPKIALSKIDHALVSPGMKVSDYRVSDGGSDHLAVSFRLS